MRKGWACSWETRAKISAAKTGHYPSDEVRKKCGLAIKNSFKFQVTMKSPEHRKKMTNVANKRWANPEFRERRALAMKNSRAFRDAMRSPEVRKKISDAAKKQWTVPEIREKMSGSNHHAWRGGCSRGIKSYGKSWTLKLKEQIRNRDDRICQNPTCCRRENGRLHSIHHIDFNKLNIGLDNLITLCQSCHQKTAHGNRDYWQEYYQNVQEMRGIT